MFGIGEENVIDNTIPHMFEYHAILPQEMTTCMKLQIEGNMHIRFPHASPILFNNQY